MIKPRTLQTVGKHSTRELHPQLQKDIFKMSSLNIYFFNIDVHEGGLEEYNSNC